jgi:hypothetical protein
MFVASLNLDVFFKKVFSNKRIAKKFLEDFLGVRITEIKLLATEHKLSDDSVMVKFDFRCKIHGKYVIIEMQQKYKPDVNKRFYLYHCASTALQLEALEPITITKPTGETYTEKNYSGLEPVITLVWMVDDNLNFTEDFIAFTTLPEAARDFITNDNLWTQPMNVLLAERAKTLKILNNKTKDLDFFSQNRLIHLFQKNIASNKNTDEPYYKWFDFAQKSKKPDNVESDFENFKNDKIMAEVIKRLKRDRLAPKEFDFMAAVADYEWQLLIEKELVRREAQKEITQQKKEITQQAKSFKLKIKQTQEALMQAEQDKMQAEQDKMQAEQDKMQAEQDKMQAEQDKTQAEQKTLQIEQEKTQIEQEKIQAEQKTLQIEQEKTQAEQKWQAEQEAIQLNAIKKLLKRGDDIPSIADFLDLTIEETTALVLKIQNT